MTLRLFLPAGGDNKMNRFVSGPWKIGNRTCIPVIIDSAPQSFVTVRTIFSHGPEPKEQASRGSSAMNPFPSDGCLALPVGTDEHRASI
jgi:hypothetical protein